MRCVSLLLALLEITMSVLAAPVPAPEKRGILDQTGTEPPFSYSYGPDDTWLNCGAAVNNPDCQHVGHLIKTDATAVPENKDAIAVPEKRGILDQTGTEPPFSYSYGPDDTWLNCGASVNNPDCQHVGHLIKSDATA